MPLIRIRNRECMVVDYFIEAENEDHAEELFESLEPEARDRLEHDVVESHFGIEWSEIEEEDQ
jgi:hypothetical protein